MFHTGTRQPEHISNLNQKIQKTTVKPHMLRGAPETNILDIQYGDNLPAFSRLCCSRVTVKHAFDMLHI